MVVPAHSLVAPCGANGRSMVIVSVVVIFTLQEASDVQFSS